ncbi:hypothetical protein GDO78_002741 [Eleutherodactylus coqui]|uniref:Uncharacterized protein n=1 Tax=Eleutherodactylus coqui TaxID=57060 RepID=A0A8J6EWV1_ELECQ|nr:hypothetical protein GDO78_002741 [Eleutherodactylus coqui]
MDCCLYLEYLIQQVQKESERMGLYLNSKKTKVRTKISNGTGNIKRRSRDGPRFYLPRIQNRLQRAIWT